MPSRGLRFRNSEMRLRGKVAVLVALAGFAGCIVCSTAWAATACCATPCNPCPILLSKSALAGSPDKSDTSHALLPAAFQPIRPAPAVARIHELAQSPTLLPPEFRRPLRN
jgi:hypothetical protein